MIDHFRTSWKERAKGDVIGTVFARFHRKMAAIVAGDTDLRVGPEDRPRVARVAVMLPKMDAVGTQPFGQPDTVVDDERDIQIGTNSLNRSGQSSNGMVVDALQPKLESGHAPLTTRRFQFIAKAWSDRGR